MPRPAPIDRVKIWNTFFALAHEQAKALSGMSGAGPPLPDPFDQRGALPEEQARILATLAFTTLAIEARANHLLEELQESRTISPEVCHAARHLPPQAKWFLLPRLAGKTAQLDASRPPHQAVAQLCALRNRLLHVDYMGLHNRLPTKAQTLSDFRGFVAAMADMNVVLDRWPAPKPEVVKKLSSF
jgi:hypothetical protein